MKAFLGRHRCIAADSMVFIYHLQAHPRYSPATMALLSGWADGDTIGVASVITLLEVLVRPKRLGLRQVEREYRQLLLASPYLSVVAVDAAVADLAAELRAKYDFATPDAIQIATAVESGASGFVTNDRDLARATEVEVLVLDDVT